MSLSAPVLGMLGAQLSLGGLEAHLLFPIAGVGVSGGGASFLRIHKPLQAGKADALPTG